MSIKRDIDDFMLDIRESIDDIKLFVEEGSGGYDPPLTG